MNEDKNRLLDDDTFAAAVAAEYEKSGLEIDAAREDKIWRRIEENLSSPLTLRRRRQNMVFGALALAAAVVLIVINVGQPGDESRIKGIEHVSSLKLSIEREVVAGDLKPHFSFRTLGKARAYAGLAVWEDAAPAKMLIEQMVVAEDFVFSYGPTNFTYSIPETVDIAIFCVFDSDTPDAIRQQVQAEDQSKQLRMSENPRCVKVGS